MAATLSAQPQAVQPAPTSAYAGFAPAAQQQPAVAEKKAADKKGRPVSSTPVTGSPWCVVWTGRYLQFYSTSKNIFSDDNRVFFYNPSTKTSVWDRPPDLYNRADVDELVKKVPEQKNGADTQHTSPNDNDEEPMDAEGQEDEEGSGSDEDDEPTRKKTKREKK